ncbi:MAG TPA: universal stress protein [Candidatus Limnocylindria bacterium]|nr:universal stress protein [Candidatus Limnocylindria bacterium]
MRLLFATDGSRGADIALDFLGALPLSNADHVVVLTVPTYSFVGDSGVHTQPAEQGVAHGEGAARAIAECARSRLAGRGFHVAVEVGEGPVAAAIENAAIRDASELVVLGSRGLGALGGRILGSVARQLARHASLPLLVVRERREAPRRILLAVDGSDESGAAVALLARLPLPSAARVTLVRVSGTPSEAVSLTRVVDRALLAFDWLALDRDVTPRSRAPEEILARANAGGADLIVLGSDGHARGGVLRGTLADQILSQAHCAVLVAKAPLRSRPVTERQAERQLAFAI